MLFENILKGKKIQKKIKYVETRDRHQLGIIYKLGKDEADVLCEDMQVRTYSLRDLIPSTVICTLQGKSLPSDKLLHDMIEYSKVYEGTDYESLKNMWDSVITKVNKERHKHNLQVLKSM